MPDQFGGVELEDEFGGVAVEEESTPPERESAAPLFTEPPPIPEMSIPESGGGIPPRLSDEEWDQLRNRIALQEEKAVPVEKTFAETISEPISEAQEGLVSPEVATRALALSAPALARFPGVTKSLGETASGFTSPINMAMLGAGAGAGPVVARGLAGGFTTDMARHLPELWRATQQAETPEEKQKAWTDLALTGGMTALGGVGTVMPAPRARPAIPPRIVEAIAKADAVGLTKSAQAVADVVREQPQQEVSSAETIRSDPGQVREAGRQPEIVQNQGRENLQQPAPEQAQSVGAQAGPESQVLLEPSLASSERTTLPSERGQRGNAQEATVGSTTTVQSSGLRAFNDRLQALRGNEAQARGNEAAQRAGQEIPKTGSVQRLLGGDDIGRAEAGASGNYGGTTGPQAPQVGARPSQESGYAGQSTGQPSSPERGGTYPASPQTPGGEVVTPSRVLRALPNKEQAALREGAVPSVLPERLSVQEATGAAQTLLKTLTELPDERAGTLKQKPAVEIGMQLGPEEVPMLKKASEEAFERFSQAVEAGQDTKARAEFGRGIFLNGAIEGANRKGPNYDVFIEQQKAAAPTPPEAVPARPVGGEPAGRPAVAGADVPAQVAAPENISRQHRGRTGSWVIRNIETGEVVLETTQRSVVEKLNTKKYEAVPIGDYLQSLSKTETTPAQLPQTEISGAGAPPVEPPVTPPTAPGAPTPPPPGTPRATLDDVYKIFEPAPKEGPTLGERASGALESFRTGFSSKFRPLNKLAEDVASAVGGTAKDVAGIFEQLKGSSGKAEADVYRFDKDVSDAVRGSEKDFNAYVFLRRSLDRLQQDAADIARAQAGENVPTLNRRKVSQYTIPELEAKLTTLSEQIGGEKLAGFNKAAEAYQTHMDQALRLQVESGRMSPEVYDAIKEGNQFYAPFKVMKYIEESMRPEGSGRKVDTTADYVKAMEGIEDPNFKLGDMLAAARQNLTLSRTLAEKNRAMQNITELAALDVDGNFVRKLKPGEDAPSGMEAVNVLENGQQQRYAVNEDVAQAVQNAGPGLPAGIVARWSSNLFRAGATTLNLAFQPVNLFFADAPRAALVSKYGVKGVTDLVRYPMDFVESLFSSIAGDVFGVQNKLFQDFLDSGAAGTTVQQYLTPEALRFKPATVASKTKGISQTILNTVPQFANAIEQTSKVLGVKRAMRIEDKESGAQLAREIPEAITEIRRFSGSPDFGRSGKWTDQYRLNLVYMFLNARVQGAVADVGRLTGRDGTSTASKTWLKVGTAVGIPTAYLYLLNNSEEYKKDYDQRPEQEKQNYWLIPKDTFITGSNGEKIRDYWRVPKREIAQWMGNAVESGMDFANQRDPQAFWKWAEGMAESISPLNIRGNTLQERAESVVSGTHPFIKAPIELATGRDTYRHRNIVPDSQKKASPEEQYTDRTAEVFKSLATAMPDVAPEVFRSPLMLENVTKNFTAGLITQFLPRQPVEGRSKAENLPLAQRFQALPYTDSSEFDQRIQKFERESADEQLKRLRDAKAIMEGNKGAKPDVLIKQMVEKHGRDEKLAERIVDLYLAEQRGITPQERRVLALPVAQRAEYLADELNGKTPEQKQALLRNYALKRILTERVAAELAPRLAP